MFHLKLRDVHPFYDYNWFEFAFSENTTDNCLFPFFFLYGFYNLQHLWHACFLFLSASGWKDCFTTHNATDTSRAYSTFFGKEFTPSILKLNALI